MASSDNGSPEARKQPANGGDHDALHEKCRQWNKSLQQADTFAAVITACQDICTIVGRTASAAAKRKMAVKVEENGAVPEHVRATLLETVRLLGRLLHDKQKTHAQQKIIAKAYYSVCFECLRHGLMEPDAVSGLTDLGDAPRDSVALYGMLNSCFLKRVQADPQLAGSLAERNLTLFLANTRASYCRSFNTVAENALTVEKLHLFEDPTAVSARYGRLWTTALMNLESPYRGVRESMLALIKWLVRDEAFMRGTILPTVAQWSWMNRNKLHVLAMLLGQYRLRTLLGALNLNDEMLANGVMLSLRYKHLYTGGQTFVRLMIRDQQLPEFVYGMVVRVIREWDLPQLMSMGKYWFGSIEARGCRRVYELLELERVVGEAVEEGEGKLPEYLRANRHEKLCYLALFFRRELHGHPRLGRYLAMLCALADVRGEEATGSLSTASRGMVIEALGYHITTDQQTAQGTEVNVLELTTKLSQYVLEMLETPASSKVCTANAVVCQRLLTHVANAQETFDPQAQAIVARLMSYEMYDRYLVPVGPTKQLVYQPTIIALRMFACFVHAFFEFPATSPHVLQTRPDATVRWVGKLLPPTIGIDDLACSFRSMVYGLQHLFRSDFEDVRNITLHMLYNKAHAFNYDATLQAQLGQAFSRPDQSQLVASLVQLLKDTVGRFRWSLELHRLDFYRGTLEEEDDVNTQLHRLVDRVTELLFGYPERSPDLMAQVMAQFNVWELLELGDAVVELTVSALNAAKDPHEPAYAGTNFNIMERSMMMLLERSYVWNGEYYRDEDSPGPSTAQVALAQRILQSALWKALKSSAVLLERSGIWMVEQYLDGRNDVPYKERLEACLQQLFDIAIQCCHRGAIEATGTCLGRVARRIMQLRQTVLSAAPSDQTAEERAARGDRFVRAWQLVDMFEQLVRKWLREHKLRGDDFRRYRGYLWALHCSLRSEVEGAGGAVEGSLVRHFLDDHVQLAVKAARVTTVDGEGLNEASQVSVLELHLLNLVAREASMNETILPQMDDMLTVALTHFNSPEWAVRNAALQLYASCVTKLTGQRQQYLDPHCDWPPVYVSFDEMLRKVSGTLGYALRRLQLIVNGDGESLPFPATPFVLLVLEFLSKLEYRAYDPATQQPVLVQFRAIAWQLLRHEHDTVRKMAARCYAQLHDFRTELPLMFENLVVALFTSATGENFRHGLCLALTDCVRRRATLGRFLADEKPGEAPPDAREQVRELVTLYYPLDEQLNIASPYRFRCALLDLLLYLGFERNGTVVLQLIHNRIAPNKHGLEVFLMHSSRICDPDATLPCFDDPAESEATEAAEAAAAAASGSSMPYEVELEPRAHDEIVAFEMDDL